MESSGGGWGKLLRSREGDEGEEVGRVLVWEDVERGDQPESFGLRCEGPWGVKLGLGQGW